VSVVVVVIIMGLVELALCSHLRPAKGTRASVRECSPATSVFPSSLPLSYPFTRSLGRARGRQPPAAGRRALGAAGPTIGDGGTIMVIIILFLLPQRRCLAAGRVAQEPRTNRQMERDKAPRAARKQVLLRAVYGLCAAPCVCRLAHMQSGFVAAAHALLYSVQCAFSTMHYTLCTKSDAKLRPFWSCRPQFRQDRLQLLTQTGRQMGRDCAKVLAPFSHKSHLRPTIIRAKTWPSRNCTQTSCRSLLVCYYYRQLLVSAPFLGQPQLGAQPGPPGPSRASFFGCPLQLWCTQKAPLSSLFSAVGVRVSV